MSNTFLGNEKYFRTETLPFQISFNTFYAELSYLLLTVHFIEAKKSDKILLLSLYKYIHVKTYKNTHTYTICPRPIQINKKSEMPENCNLWWNNSVATISINVTRSLLSPSNCN